MRTSRRALLPVGALVALLGGLPLAAGVPAGGAARAAAPPKAGSVAGQLLVATPEMPDPRFAGTVIYMVRHDGDGALGIVVNRPFREVPIALLLERLGLEAAGARGDIRLHYGGPVEPGRAFVLHTADYAAEGTQTLPGGIALTVHPDVLRALGAGKGPRRVLLALGYAGWAPGQLEGELRVGAWAVVPADPAIVFDDRYETKWDRALAKRRLDL